MKKFLVVIVGPTAVGKTKVSVQLAQYFQTEIVSADARQFYKEMKIGTAVPSVEEQQGIPHHFIAHLSIHEPLPAGVFEKIALEKIKELHKTHDLVILTGGSGLFIKAVLKGLDSFPAVDPSIEQQLQIVFENNGIAALQQLLKEHDPAYAEEVDNQNPQRLLRALGVSLSSGRPYSSFRKQSASRRNFTVIKIGVTMERKLLYNRINERVDSMMSNGLLNEAMELKDHASLRPLQTVGYQELFEYISGNVTLDHAVGQIKQHSRNYAKRQITWFRKEQDINWFKPEQVGEMIVFIEEKVSSMKE